jgi:hypothetical protein
MNTQASALRFFFTITLGRADLAYQLPARAIRASCRGSLLQIRWPG